MAFNGFGLTPLMKRAIILLMGLKLILIRDSKMLLNKKTLFPWGMYS